MRCEKKGKTFYLIYWNALIYDMYVCMYVCMCKYLFLHGSINLYFVNWYIFMSMSRYRCLPRQPSPAMSL
jgi:hypothetical protein